jgi:uncharacterized protein (TIGR02145 family)
MNREKLYIFTAIFIAMTFTFSCSSGDGGGNEPGGNPNASELCDGVSYDPSVYRCELGELIGKCRGKDYYIVYEQCVNGVVENNSSNNNNSSSSRVVPSSSSSSNTISGSGDYCVVEYNAAIITLPSMCMKNIKNIGVDCSGYNNGEVSTGRLSDSCPIGYNCADFSTGIINEPILCDNPNSSSSSSMVSSSSLACTNPSSYDSFKTVKIDGQTWMAENLNYAACGSKCYDNDPANCAKYGRLYDWATAMNLPLSCNLNNCSDQIQTGHRGVCPSGWHIPSDTEWEQLELFVDNSLFALEAGRYLKSKDGWEINTGLDTYEFAALPGGFSDGRFLDVGVSGFWWSSNFDSYSSFYTSCTQMKYNHSHVSSPGCSKSQLLSVRCLQD